MKEIAADKRNDTNTNTFIAILQHV